MTVSREEVRWCYRMILGREAESDEAVDSHLDSPDLATLRDSFFRSPEFAMERVQAAASSAAVPFLPLDLPRNEVEHDASPLQMAECIAKIREAWTHLGIVRPHFSVITDRQFLPERLDENIDEFWKSGDNEAAMVERMLARHGFSALGTRTCLEYGCGVGRVTTGLARKFGEVDAYDISAGHLALAERRARDVGVSNVRFHLCSENFLEPLVPCDVFYSRIVFQHNPPPVIARLVRMALQALNPGGMAIFQVPTYSIGYGYGIDAWLATEHELDMQMHCLPQESIFAIIADEGCVPVEVREDNYTGQAERFISNTFFVRKPTS